jgi:hypothetical protein
MLNDELIMSAVSNIQRRSERQDDTSKLIKSFVDNGIITQLENDLPQKIVPLSNVSLYMNQSLRNTPAI